MTERVGFGKRFGAQMIDGIVGSIGGMRRGAVFGSLRGGGVAAAAIGEPAVFVSVDAMHQGPQGGGPVVAIVDVGD